MMDSDGSCATFWTLRTVVKVQVVHLSFFINHMLTWAHVQACGTHTFIEVGFLYLTTHCQWEVTVMQAVT